VSQGDLQHGRQLIRLYIPPSHPLHRISYCVKSPLVIPPSSSMYDPSVGWTGRGLSLRHLTHNPTVTSTGETLQQYRMFPDLVKVVIGADCASSLECMKTDENPTGIPRWKREFYFPCHMS
jgi:hypothetical protein